MNRRETVLALIALGAVPVATFAQQKAKVWRVGFLGFQGSVSAGYLFDAFVQGLKELGYSDSSNLLIERRYADGQEDRLPALAMDLVKQNVDVIVAPVPAAAEAARIATRTIPIVGILLADPVKTGLAASLARPGGNITGTMITPVELTGKRVQLLKEAVPKISRVAVLFSTETSESISVAETQRAAKALEIKNLTIQVKILEDFSSAFDAARRWRADSIIPIPNNLNFRARKLIAELAVQYRLPAVYGPEESVEAGGLMSYGASYVQLFRHAASFVDKILKGANPATLPIERPTTFDLVINLKTAKALGIQIPRPLLVRASRVIE